MGDPSPLHLSRRERQIMEILYTRGQASVAEVLESMHDPPSYSAVRTILRLLEEKGHVRHKEEGRKFIYAPTVPHRRARRSALKGLLQTFFGGSVSEAVASLIDLDRNQLSRAELERLSELIDKAGKEGR